MDRALLERVFHDQQQLFADQQVEIRRNVDLATHLRQSKEITTITGVRRCGKSTLLRQIANSLPKNSQTLYTSFEDPRYVTFEASDFEPLFEIWQGTIDRTKPQYLFFDEVQLVAGWERWIDHLSKRANTKIYITGSNAALLSSELSTLLTGRHQDLHLTPFSFKELFMAETGGAEISVNLSEGRAIAQKLFNRFRQFGGFPRVYLETNSKLLRQYYIDIIERDILRRLRRVPPRYILELGTILASESSRLFNRSAVARTLGLKDQVTVGKYTAAFIATYLYSELRAFSPSVRKQLRSLSKFYAVDHAIAQENGFSAEPGSGTNLELMVQIELRRRGHEIFYWHSADDYEVDFILVDKRKPIAAIQVAHSLENADTRARELRALAAARDELKIKELFIVTRHEEEYLKAERVRVVPFSQFAMDGVV